MGTSKVEYVIVRHSCGASTPAPFLNEDTLYANPLWCANCGSSFFPKDPRPVENPQPRPKLVDAERFNKILSNIKIGDKK